MTRDELAGKIYDTVKNGRKISLSDMENYSRSHIDDFKSGIYFLYNSSNECIYVGKVGNSKTSSLYMRMIGNGSGSHKSDDKRWYSEVAYGYWHKFNLDDDNLSKVERLAIYGMNQPKYNDKDTDQSSIDGLASVLDFKVT